MTFRQAIANAKIAVLDDGFVTLGETSVLLRIIKPFVRQGNPGAIRLESMLMAVRRDGIITPEESNAIAAELQKLSVAEISLDSYIQTIPDFPKPGVMFRDVTGILDNADGVNLALDMIDAILRDTQFDVVVAAESRGFFFGPAVASRHRKAFVPVRKPGKLPRETICEQFALEYGMAELHMHADAILPGERVVFVDDLLATGGTAAAAARLVERLGGEIVKMVFPIELEGFGARHGALSRYDVCSLVRYPGK